VEKEMLLIRKAIFILLNIATGFFAFFMLVLLGEIFSGNAFHFEPIHFQIALLGGILQGSYKYFKYRNQSI
jgi:hypothetical protein